MEKFKEHPLYRKHDLDSMMTTLWSFYAKNFIVLFLVSFIFNLFTQFITSTLDLTVLTGITDPYEMLAEMKNWLWPVAGVMAISMIMALVLQYYIIYKPVNSDLNIFSAIFRSMQHLLPFLFIMILFVIFSLTAMVLGLLVFVIGILFAAIYVFMIGLFILPVLMVEGNNIGSAAGRIFTLSHRHFGPNLGWTAIIVLIIFVGSIILSSLILIPFSGSFINVLSNPSEAVDSVSYLSNPWFIFLSAVSSAVFAPIAPILAAILYFNARAAEEEKQVSVAENDESLQRTRVEDLYARPYSDDHPDNPDNKDN